MRHYDKGPCRNKLGHSRASVMWNRTQVRRKQPHHLTTVCFNLIYSEADRITKAINGVYLWILERHASSGVGS